MAAVALVDSSENHCFMSDSFVTKFEVLVLPGDDMEVTMADKNQVEAYKTYLVPLVICSACCKVLQCVVKGQI